MDILAKLVKKHKLSRVCRIGTWIVAIIGTVHIVSQAYALWQIYRQTLTSSFQEPPMYSPLATVFLNYIPEILTSAAVYIFYCILLYAAGIVFEAIGAQASGNEKSKALEEQELEGIVYTSLK